MGPQAGPPRQQDVRESFGLKQALSSELAPSVPGGRRGRQGATAPPAPQAPGAVPCVPPPRSLQPGGRAWGLGTGGGRGERGGAGTRPSLSCRLTAAARCGRREAAASRPVTAPRCPTVRPAAAGGGAAGRGGQGALSGRGRGAGGSANGPLASPRPQGTARSPAAPCPAWTASPASWTASPRGGSPSDTPARRVPASTRGPGRPGRRRPDGPTRRYEGRQRYPANPPANKACYNTAGSPGASLNASPGVTGGGGGPAACAGTGPHPAGLRGLCGVAQICPRSPPAAGTFFCLLWE